MARKSRQGRHKDIEKVFLCSECGAIHDQKIMCDDCSTIRRKVVNDKDGFIFSAQLYAVCTNCCRCNADQRSAATDQRRAARL